MAANVLGRNMDFPIYNADGTAFHSLVLHKSTVDSVVMSLGDKITGDVCYADNTLDVTMQEYIELDGVHYVLVTPPTIVREGMASDNSELKGMTKYSFTFYHPMYVLGNIPFCDVAVSSGEEKYLSQDKTFSWIGYPDDFIAKLNKNLQETEWIVVKSDRFPVATDSVLSEVQQFDKATIADALKRGYEIWDAPYVVGKINVGDEHYSEGKRFKVIFGLPFEEIYENETQRQLDNPFVFHFGQGVGLKNNSRTPRNNKIITRISGYGSENNIPYGYPQIPWYGDSRWDYTEYQGSTINYDSDGHVTNTPKTTAYPLYMGIVGGAYVKLIKHPFTRTHLMPSIYSQTVFNKVSPYNSDGTPNTNYNPNAEIKDYYDAIATQEYPYPNEIISSAPSYEIHGFDDIKPELGQDAEIVGAIPLNADLTPADSWVDDIDDDGNYLQSYFQITLPQLSFDIYACAAITEEMQINMRGGACIGCTFGIQVDWDDYKMNFYDSDGNFLPNGSQRDLTKYPKSNLGSISVIVQKDTQTFGTLMPNIYQQPTTGDTFVILGISLPLSYITNAETRLDGEMKSYMLENNIHYYDYPLKFDEHFLSTHTSILSQIKPNSIVHFDFAGEELELYVKQLTVKYGNAPLPQYDITLTDDVEITLNPIGRVADDVEKLGSLISILRQNYSRNVWMELSKKLSKTNDDTAQGFITFMRGLQVGQQFVSGLLGEGGVFRKENDGTTYLEADKMYVRMKAYFDTVEIREYQHTAGNRIASVAGNKCVRVEWYSSSNQLLEQTQANRSSVAYFRCYFRASDGEDTVRNNFAIGDQVYCHITSVAGSSDNPNEKGLNQKHYWRLCVGRNVEGTLTDDGEAWIDISNAHNAQGNPTDVTLTIGGTQYTHKSFQSGSDFPEAQDSMVQLGNINDGTRQGAIIEFVTGANAPSYQIYQDINDFDLTDKNYIQLGYNSATGHADLKVYGDAYIGDRNRSTYIEYKQDDGTQQHNPVLNIKAKINAESTIGNQSLQQYIQENQNNYDDTEVWAEIGNLQEQIDGEIDTWFYNYMPVAESGGAPVDTVPLTNKEPYKTWYDADTSVSPAVNTERLKHLGDVFYDNKSGYAFRFSNTGTEQSPVFAWVVIQDSAVIKALEDAAKAQDTADHKRRVFLTTPTVPYDEGDLWVNAVWPASGASQGSTYNNDILKCKSGCSVPRTGHSSFDISDWELASKYTDDSAFNGYISAILNGSGSSGDAATVAAAQKAIKDALGGGTVVDGGLLLTSLIAMRKKNQDNTYTTWAGISGTYDSREESDGGAKGHGIAAWYGGAMVDHEDSVLAEDYAKSLFRFDGSGYLAGGNISWDENGIVTIANVYADVSGTPTSLTGTLQTLTNLSNALPLSIIGSTTYIDPQYGFTNLSVLGKPVATQEWVGQNYLSVEFFNRLFHAYRGNTRVEANDTSTVIDNIKAMFGFWTQQYVSALGQGSGGGGGGGGDVTWDALEGSDSRPINISHLTGALSDYVTTSALSTALNGYATQAWVSQNFNNYTLPAATSSALGGIKIGYSQSGQNYAVKLSSQKAYVSVPWTDTTVTEVAKHYTPVADALSEITASISGSAGAYAKDTEYTVLTGVKVQRDAAGHVTGVTYTAQKVKDTNTTYSAGTADILTAGTDTTNRVWKASILRAEYDKYLLLTGGTLSGTLNAKDIVIDSANTLKIGDIYLAYDSVNNAIKVYKLNGSTEVAANFYALGGISALGMGSDGGGGTGDVTWDALKGTASSDRWIDISYLSNALAILTGYTTSGSNYAVQKDANNHLYVSIPGVGTATNIAGGAAGSIPYQSAEGTTTFLAAGSNGQVLKMNSSGVPYWASDANTKNTAGTTNKAATKLFLVGAMEQSANPVTYSNVNVYIGTDNKLYSNGKVVLDTDDISAWAKAATKPSYAFSEITGSATASQLPSIEELTNFSTKVYDASASRTKNTVLAAPNGSAGAATFRALVAADIPNLSASKITSGTFDAARIPSLAISKITGLQTALDSKLDIAFFSALFKAYNGNTEVTPNNDTSNVDSIKAMFGFWTQQYISALGQGTDGGGSVDMDTVWNALGNATSEQINISHLTTALNGYATQSWVQQQGYTTNIGTVTQVKVGTTAYNPTNGIVSLPAYPTDYWKTGDSRTKNTVLAAPNGSNGTASFRALVAADIPDLSSTYSTSARVATLEGYFTDGVANNANVATQLRYCYAYDGGMGKTNPYHLAGECTVNGTGSRNTTIVFLVDNFYSDARGILLIQGRVESGASTINTTITYAKWIVKAAGLDVSDFILTTKVTSNSLTCRLYYKITETYRHARFRVLDEGNWAVSVSRWQLFNTSSDTAGDYIFNTIPADETQFVSVDDTCATNATYADNADKLDNHDSSYFAKDSDVTTLQGYFDASGNANSAKKLTTVSKTLWGNTYWTSGGVPTSIGTSSTPAALNYVTNIDSLLYFDTTTSKLGVGTSSPSYKLHIDGTFGVTGAMTLSSTLSVSSTTTTDTLAISNTSATAHISFARGSYNYIQAAVSGGKIGFVTNGKAANTTNNIDLLISDGAVSVKGTLSVSGATTLTGLLTANGNIKTGSSDGAYVQVGGIRLVYDSTNNAIKVVQSDGTTAANFYATGAVSALGMGTDGGGGGQGDVTWDLLKGTASSDRWIDASYIAGTLSSYATQSWVSANFNNYTLPTASSSTKGGVKVGATLSISSEVLNLKATGVTADTYTKVTVDTYGRVTAGNTLSASDIPELSSTYATSARATTLEGYFTSGIAKDAWGLYPIRMASGDDYDTYTDYTIEKGSFVAVNFNSLTSADVTLDDIGKYTILASFGYNLRTMQIKGAAYSDTLKYRRINKVSDGVYNFSEWKTFAFLDSNVASATNLSGGAAGSIPYQSAAGTTAYIAAGTEGQVLKMNGSGVPFWSSDVNTWRNVYVGGSSKVGTGTDTKAINFNAGDGISIAYAAAGTGTGKSGSDNYFNVSITNSGVRSVSISGNYLRVNTNGTDADLTIPYATKATTADKLSVVSKTLFGNTYWTSGGVPTSIGTSSSNASLNYVANLTMSGYIKIGSIYIGEDSEGNLEIYKLSGSTHVAANLYARGAVSALGQGSDGGGGQGDVTWQLLESNDTRPINISHLTGALSGYALTSQIPTDYWKTGDTRTKNTVLAAPNGSNGAATFRALVAADIPNLAASKITSGTFDAARIPDLSSIYSTVSRVTTLEGYFTDEVANSAYGLAQYPETVTSLSTFTHSKDLIYKAFGGGNTIEDKPTGVGAFGVFSFKTAASYYGQIVVSSVGDIYSRSSNSLSGNWKTVAFTTSNVASATKLQTACTISLTGNVTGSVSFDGSADASITTTIGTGVVTNAMLAGSIANSKLVNSSVTVNGTSVSLGSSITTAKWGTARTVTISDSDGTNTKANNSIDGSSDFTLKLPSTIKATLTGNASTATKLAASVTLWGQSFDGTADVSGNLTGVGTISADGNNTITKTTASASYFEATNSMGSIELLMGASGNRGIYNGTSAANGTWVIATNGTNTWMAQGNVGVGISSPTRKLDVLGTIGVRLSSTSEGGNIYSDSNGLHLDSAESAGLYLGYGSSSASSTQGTLGLIFNGTAFKPLNVCTGLFSLGTSSARWNAIYGTTLNIGSTATISGLLTASGNIQTSTNDGAYIKIGNIYLGYDHTNGAIEIYKLSGTTHVAANLYARGAVSALGMGSDSGGGGQGDVTWRALAGSTTEQINISHLTTALAGYATKATTLSGYGITDAYTKTESDGRFLGIREYTLIGASSTNTVSLNTINTAGTYAQYNDASTEYVTDRPTTNKYSFRLEVIKSRNSYYVRQRYQEYNTRKVYERTSDGNGSFASATWYLVQDNLGDYLLSSDISSWAKASTKPSYAFSEITGTATASQVPSIENLTNFSTKVYDASTSRTANYVLAAPNGSSGVATFRKLVSADIPNLAASKITSGTFDAARIPDLSWNKITSDKPTTLSGYGITDAKIASGVITLGSSTITPVTSVSMTVPTGFSVSGTPISKTGTLALTYASGYEGFTTTLKDMVNTLWAMFTREGSGTPSDPYVIKANYGLYTDSFISALGQGSDGGGGGGDVTWDALAAQATSNRTIHLSYITAALTSGGYATQTWVQGQGYLTTYTDTKNTAGTTNKASTKMFLVGATSQGANPQTYSNSNVYIGTDNCLYSNSTKVLTAHQTLYTLSVYGNTTKVLDFKPNANASLYIKSGGDITITNDTTNKYITLSYSHPTNGANTTISAASGKVLGAITVNSLGHVTSVSSKTLAAADIPDISGTYATSSRVTTLEGYFTNGVANKAEQLNTSRTIWGQSFNGTADITGSLYLNNGSYICVKDNPAEGETATDYTALGLSQNNALLLGYGTAAAGYSTNIYGRIINLRYGTARTTGLFINESGNIGIGTSSPSYKLHVNGTFNATGNSNIGGTLSVASAATITGTLTANNHIYLANNKSLYWYNEPASGDAVAYNTIGLNDSNSLFFGYGTAGAGYSTYIYGYNIFFNYGTTRTNGLTLDYNGSLSIANGVYMSNDKAIFWKNNPSSGTAQSYSVLSVDTTNSIHLAYGMSGQGYSTYINGNNVYLRYGTSRTTGLTLDSSGNVTVNNDLTVGTLTNGSMSNATQTIYGKSVYGGGSNPLTTEINNSSLSFKFSGTSVGTIALDSTGSDLCVTAATTRFSGNVYMENGKSLYMESFVSSGTPVDLDCINVSNSNVLSIGRGMYDNTMTTTLYGYYTNIYAKSYIRIFCGTSSQPQVFRISSNGNVRIGTGTPSYKLDVDGDIYATGGVTCLSDIRYKNILCDLPLTVEQVADAPAIRFLWKDNRSEGEQAGTIAQYWQKVLPEVVKDKSGELSMQYGVAAVVATIVTAKKVVDHERRIAELEKENERLRYEVEQLKAA